MNNMIKTKENSPDKKTTTTPTKGGEKKFSAEKNREVKKDFKNKKHFFKSKNFIYTKRECYITKNKIKYIDFKDVNLLKRFVKKSGQIISNRITGATNINQRKIVKAIKRARFMGLLPFRGNVENPIFPNFNFKKRTKFTPSENAPPSNEKNIKPNNRDRDNKAENPEPKSAPEINSKEEKVNG